jgi:penicillin-binding protein 2
MKFIKKNNLKKIDPFLVQEGTNKFGLVDDFAYRLEWVENVYASDNKGRESISREFDYYRLYFISIFVFLILAFIIGRTAWLQIVKGDYYYRMAEGNRIRIERVEAKRGVIFDRTGKPLVSNAANFLLYLIPADLPTVKTERDNLISQLSQALGSKTILEIEGLLAKIKRGSLESYRPLSIEDNIEYEKAMRIYLLSDNWPGVVLTTRTRREYNLNTFSMSHILGYTGKISQVELDKSGDEYLPIDYIGKMGIESFWENELKGTSGMKQVEVDALGKEKKIISKQDAKDGQNIILAIDLDAQKKIEEIIAVTLQKLKLTKASAVIMNPNNGEIIAMVSLPAFNNNSFAKGISKKEYDALISRSDLPLFNRSISGEYPSGSTIKPVIASAALQDGIINENTAILSTGGIKINEWFFPDWKPGGHGVTDVKRALAESINTFFYYVGGGYQDFKGLGVDRINYYEEKFGLGAQTGIDLPGERAGFLPTKEWKEKAKKEKWYIGDTYHVSIGQGDLLVTPLQVALYTSAIANGGVLYRPHIVKEIVSDTGKSESPINTDPVRKDFISPQNINIVRDGMRQTVTNGSGRKLNTLPVAVAGKTGTAQSTTSKIKTHAWFTGFAPFEKPQVVVSVLIEDGGGGDVIAVPIVRDFLNWYFRDKKPKKASSTADAAK